AELLLPFSSSRAEGRKEQPLARMAPRALHAADVYRRLLKSVKKHIGKEDYKSHFRDFIAEEFQKNRNLSVQSSVQNKLKLADDYTFLLNSVHHHKELLFSYNIAVDRSAEIARTLGKSAASVGLQLPESNTNFVAPGYEQIHRSLTQNSPEEVDYDEFGEEADEEPVFVLTDEWAEFFAKSEARRREAKNQAKKQGKN
ncbi:hypothetical protein Nepgr_029787, partial [Nepenthes gracilis]